MGASPCSVSMTPRVPLFRPFRLLWPLIQHLAELFHEWNNHSLRDQFGVTLLYRIPPPPTYTFRFSQATSTWRRYIDEHHCAVLHYNAEMDLNALHAAEKLHWTTSGAFTWFLLGGGGYVLRLFWLPLVAVSLRAVCWSDRRWIILWMLCSSILTMPKGGQIFSRAVAISMAFSRLRETLNLEKAIEKATSAVTHFHSTSCLPMLETNYPWIDSSLRVAWGGWRIRLPIRFLPLVRVTLDRFGLEGRPWEGRPAPPLFSKREIVSFFSLVEVEKPFFNFIY